APARAPDHCQQGIRSHVLVGEQRSYTRPVNGNELLRRLNRLGRARGLTVRIELERGKGSHATVYFGDRYTIIKDRRKEIGPGLLHAMLRQLGLSERDLG